MIGAICRRDILAHPVITIRCFGWTVFFKAIVSGRKQTFLSLLAESRVLPSQPVEAPEWVGRCVKLEWQAMRIYDCLARRFTHPAPAGLFFQTLARQEHEHAELLQLCRAVGGHGPWDLEHLALWRQSVPRLEARMREAESSAKTLTSLADALHLVLRIESSEIKHVFASILSACRSDFVEKLAAFRNALSDHVSYICGAVPQWEPELDEACRELREAQTRATARPG